MLHLGSHRAAVGRRLAPLALAAATIAVVCTPLLHASGPAREAPAAQAVKGMAPPSVVEWSNAVWSAAQASDLATVDALLADPPAAAGDAELARLREMVTLRLEHQRTGQAKLDQEIAKKRAEVRRALDQDDLSRALIAAANLKYLCREWVCELEHKDIAEAIERTEKAAEKAEAAGDLILAQELYFRLRGLYESTTEAARFRHWDSKLDKVSRRIALLASYAPKQLTELRKAASARRDASARSAAKDAADEAKAEGREVDAATQRILDAKELDESALLAPTGDEWREEVQFITEPMLLQALRKLASEHVDNSGWQPLLAGSLEALELLGSTSALSETFPKLGDQEARDAWLAAIHGYQEKLRTLDPEKGGRVFYRDMLKDLREVNRASIEIPDEVLIKEFGEGATHVLGREKEDPYSEIIWPERLRRFKQSVDGKLIGVGIQIRHDDKREIMVTMPLEGSPAKRQGVKAEDRIVAVDDQPTLGWSLNRAVEKITGPPGEKVKLTVRRATDQEGGEKTIDFDLERQAIKLRSAHGWWKKELDGDGNPVWDWYIAPEAGIGYLRLTGFNEDSFQDFHAAIQQMNSERKLNGLILDLRNNPGGLLQSAVDFVNAFVERGEIVSCQDRFGQKVPKMTRTAQPNRAFLKGLPVVVLVNEGSASASEIVSGSLRAHGAAVVVGQRTFGKGSVQEVAPITDKDSKDARGEVRGEALVKVTTQHYVIPPGPGETQGRLVHKRPGAQDWGVNPHIEVRLTPEQFEKSNELRMLADSIDDGPEGAEPKERPNVADLLSQGLDPQLEYALLLLEARVLKDLENARIARGQG